MYHTASPLPQTRLSRTLATLLLSLPAHLFLPFLHAFYATLLALYPQLPFLRLDKYLYLLRRYVAAAFTYLARRGWDPRDDLTQGYLALMQGDVGPLSPGRGSQQAKVPDGLRYHVLDVWAEELAQIVLNKDEKRSEEERGDDDNDEQGAELMMSAVRALAQDAKGKVVRARARGCVSEWERLKSAGRAQVMSAAAAAYAGSDKEDEDEEVEHGDGSSEWSGFGD